MKVIHTKGMVDDNGVIHVNAPTGLAPGSVDMIMVLQPNQDVHKRQYDFSDLTGKLQWQGDPQKEQIQLRNEW